MRLGRATALLLAVATLGIPNVTRAQGYTETDLVSDIAGRAQQTDSNLVNPWGLVPGPTGVFWVADNVTGKSTLYDASGTVLPLVVTIPGGRPTGIAVTEAATFEFTSGDSTVHAVFIFVSQSGTISAWSPANPTAATQVASTPGAVYLGVALASTASGARLYANDFAGGKIDVFDGHFQRVTLPYSFADPTLPAGYSPFNIASINGQLYVAYAMRNASSGDEVAGPGLGIIDVFNMDGLLIYRFANFGALDAPYAMVVSPAGFGEQGGRLLVGNFGDGHINAFTLSSGDLVGAVHTPLGDAIAPEGLWGLHFGRQGSAPGAENRLYFAAGIGGEAHGLFGYIAPVVRDSVPPVGCVTDARGVGFWRNICGDPQGEHGGGDGHGDGEGDGHGHGDGHGKGHEKGKGQHGNDGEDGDGHDHGIGADSLQVLLGCVSNGAAAFGSSGCFTAGCDLLQAHEHMRNRDRAAQTLLVLLLDRCAGLLCDATVLDCVAGDRPRTVGEVIASLDSALCGGDDVTLARLTQFAGCVLGGGDGEDGGGDDGKVKAGRPAELMVLSRSANPLRIGAGMSTKLVLTTTTPSVVQLKICDAAGRLIAQPLRSTVVSGALEVNWDGRDLRGTLVPPGNYFYRASTDKAFVSGRIVVVR